MNIRFKIKEKIEWLHSLARAMSVEISTVCLAYVAMNEDIDKFVIG